MDFEVATIIMSDPGMRAMPLRFWKKEKPEKGKEETPDEKKEKEEKKPTPAPREEKVKPAEPEVKKAEAKKAEAKKPEAQKPETKAPPRPPQPGEVEAAVNEAHAAIVETGLTVPQTPTVFAKRAASYPGGEAAFLADFRSTPHRAVTRVLADWLGFHVPEVFEPETLLADVNLRLSSFKLRIQLKDLTWLDKVLTLRKATLACGERA